MHKLLVCPTICVIFCSGLLISEVSNFYCLLLLLCIFQFFSVLIIVTNFTSEAANLGNFLGLEQRNENYACQNDGWRFCIS
jgi:hypothetical protein